MNSLKWTQRMNRQVTALQQPNFADPSDPAFREHAEQDFKTFDKQTVQVTDWESFTEPERFKKAPTVHHAEPESESKSGQKVDDNVNLLASAKGKTVELPEEEPTEMVVEQEEVPAEPGRPITLQEAPKKQVANPPARQYNTSVPEGGFLMRPRDEILKPSESTQKPQTDQWSVNSGKKKKLVVRATDGKRVDKVDRSSGEGYNEDSD